MAGEITGVRVTGDSTARKIDYDALANKPTIPTKVSDLSNDSGFISSIPVDGTTIGLDQDGRLTLLVSSAEEVSF